MFKKKRKDWLNCIVLGGWCDIKKEVLDDVTFKALKTCITGFTTKEIVSEYAIDDETGNLKIVKQKISEKNVPPNTDIIKLIYQQVAQQKVNYESLSDEELEQEKQRLILELKEKENVGGKNKSKN